MMRMKTMMTMNETTSERRTARKPYAKPEVHQYALRAEEAVLGFCKTSGGAGPNIGDCDLPSACLSLGS